MRQANPTTRNRILERLVVETSSVDVGHPADSCKAAEFLDDTVVRDGLADQLENSSPRAAILGWTDGQVNADAHSELKWDC